MNARCGYRPILHGNQNDPYIGELFNAGLIKFSEEKEKKTGMAFSYYSDWRHWIWNDESPVSDLFNTVCEFEIESEVSYLSKWLQNIDAGAMLGRMYCRAVALAYMKKNKI